MNNQTKEIINNFEVDINRIDVSDLIEDVHEIVHGNVIVEKENALKRNVSSLSDEDAEFLATNHNQLFNAEIEKPTHNKYLNEMANRLLKEENITSLEDANKLIYDENKLYWYMLSCGEYQMDNSVDRDSESGYFNVVFTVNENELKKTLNKGIK